MDGITNPPFLKATDFSQEDFNGKNLLLELRIHVTERCNLKCTYCLSNAPHLSEKSKLKNQKLTLEEIKSNIFQAKQLGIKTVSITGSGERLLYPELNKSEIRI